MMKKDVTPEDKPKICRRAHPSVHERSVGSPQINEKRPVLPIDNQKGVRAAHGRVCHHHLVVRQLA